MIIALASSNLPASALYQPSLGSSSAEKASYFQGIPTKRYNLRRWASIFQVIEADASQKIIFYPEGMKNSKGEALKPPDCTLPLAEPISNDLMYVEGQEMAIWLKYWHHRDQE